jgi:predicted DNA-binding protein
VSATSVPLSVRLPREQFTKLGNLAVARDRSISYLVRVAIDRYLAAVAVEEA